MLSRFPTTGKHDNVKHRQRIYSLTYMVFQIVSAVPLGVVVV